MNPQVPKLTIHPSAWISSSAVMTGTVIVEENVYVSDGVMIVAEEAPVHIEKGSVIMENVILKSSQDKNNTFPLLIKENTLIGPHAYLVGCTVEKNSFLAGGTKIHTGTYIGQHSMIGLNAVVHIDTNVKPKTVIPTHHIAFGNPMKIYPPTKSTEKMIAKIESSHYLDTLFQAENKNKSLTYKAVMEKYRQMLFDCKSTDIIKNLSLKEVHSTEINKRLNGGT
ncbi:gamma carbonic anhydrase family protein [Priestia megaterium]|uniref:gamma carbonic anhydrase family protein n=1 Tax=Priestia megaterium TaxID=1404 RepID=UPI00366B789C